MSASTIAAVAALIDAHRTLIPLLEEHLEDNEGEILPHLVLSDVIRWLVAYRETDPQSCRSIMDWLEQEYIRGPGDVREMIAVSGVEMLPDPGQPGYELRDLLGPALQEVDPWLA